MSLPSGLDRQLFLAESFGGLSQVGDLLFGESVFDQDSRYVRGLSKSVIIEDVFHFLGLKSLRLNLSRGKDLGRFSFSLPVFFFTFIFPELETQLSLILSGDGRHFFFI